MEKIEIYDTTLRDGEQTPGLNFNLWDKLKIAKQLEKLHVDVIEAGFPISSEGEFAAVKAIAQELREPVVAAMARVAKADIDACWEAIRYAERPRIHLFLATSDIHLEHKLNKSRDEILAMIAEGLRYAGRYTSELQFTAEDASRTDKDFLCRAFATAIEAGAKTVNIADTVGYALPEEFGALFRYCIENTPGAERVVFGAHCHNDLGLAVANTLIAVENGARHVEATMNGLGERAGNAALEEIVMALRTRFPEWEGALSVHPREIYRSSRLISRVTGVPIPPNKPVVGSNAFAHESGIHQAAVLRDSRTYEVIDSRDLGYSGEHLVFGKHSGRSGLAAWSKSLGYDLSQEQLDALFPLFKALADRKNEVHDEDVEVLIEDLLNRTPEKWKLDYIHISTGSTLIPTATVRLRTEEGSLEAAATGDGPINAIFAALEKATGITGVLHHYALDAITGGKDALGQASVRVESGGNIYSGRGYSTDILEASALAYLSALNKAAIDSVQAG